MPFNGSGTFVSLAPPNFPAVPFTTILASMFNANMQDIFTNGLTKCLTRDGQSTPTANLPMAGFKFTGLGNGTNDTDSAALGQTIALRGQVGVVDWDTRTTTGVFEATAASLTTPAANFPPTSALGELIVIAQGALVDQMYKVANQTFMRQKVSGTWTTWQYQTAGKNYLVNGAVQIWQDVTSLGASTGTRYAADMIRSSSTGTTYSVVRLTLGVNGIAAVPELNFYQSTTVTSVAGASNFCNIGFVMEGVSNLAGKQVTFSFWANASAVRNVAISFQQFFGTGGAPSATVDTPAGLVSISNVSFNRVSVTATIPSVVGKTLGSNNDDILIAKIWLDAGSTFNTPASSLGQQSGTYNILGAKLEEGSVATQFETPDVSAELLRCQRYYIRTTGGATYGPMFWQGPVTNGLNIFSVDKFPVFMRAVPTMAFADIANANFAVGVAASNTSAQGTAVAKLTNATATNGFYSMSYTADARY